MVATQELMNRCADMRLRADDGTIIPCCRYNCLSTCTVLRELAESMDVQPGQEFEVPVPNVPSLPLRLAVESLHGLRCPTTLSLDEVKETLHGLDVLGCTCLDFLLLDRAWSLVQKAPLDVFTSFAPHFLQSKTYQLPCLKELVRRMPLWTDFQDWLSAWSDLDATLAKVMVANLVKFYPACTVLLTIFDELPNAAMTETTLLELIGLAHTDVFYHPEDVRLILQRVVNVFTVRHWSPVVLGALKTFLGGLKCYEVAPSMANDVHGSVVTFEATPHASVRITFDSRPATPKTMVVAPWLRLEYTLSTGHIHPILRLWKLDAMARKCQNVQLRITATSGTVTHTDVWYTWDDIDPRDVLTVNSADSMQGSQAALSRTLMSPSLRAVRLDVYYGRLSILREPF